jgi:protein-glutamine gamma-glutamyltransferase
VNAVHSMARTGAATTTAIGDPRFGDRRSRGRTGPHDGGLDPRTFDLLCLTVACVLATHASHLPPWFAIGLIVVLLARWLQRRRRRGRVPAWIRFGMLVAVPAVVVAVYGTPFGRAPGAAVACGLLVLKLLESERARDAYMAVGFACFILMSALLFTQSLAMTLMVALVLLPALATLRSLQSGLRDERLLSPFVPAATLLAAGVPMALLAFLFVPRLTTPLWGTPGNGIARTGITDRMAPGELRDLLIDDSVAMRIGFDGSPPPVGTRYFRGMVLWYFDGRAWLPGLVGDRNMPPERVAVESPAIGYDVTLLPTQRRWLFALDVPVDAPTGAALGADRTLVASRPVSDTLHYHADSVLGYRLAPALEGYERAAALQLPPDFDPKARALAAAWRKRSAGDGAQIVFDALKLFRDGGFSYNLAAPPLGRNSVDDFLFGTRQGFCEHYAGAFTFLMRAAGVPARVVVGYHGGYWNPYADYLLIRQSDAHAWSEVWLRGRGWVRVDPTAIVRRVIQAGAGTVAEDDGTGGNWVLRWRDRLDIVNRWWDQGVIGFDALRQSHLLQPLGIARAGWNILAAALAAAILLALAIGALLVSVPPRRPPRDLLDAAQRRIQHRLARAGVARAAGEGPRDYYARAARELPRSGGSLRHLAGEYLALRYAFHVPPPERVREFARKVRNFHPRRAVKQA